MSAIQLIYVVSSRDEHERKGMLMLTLKTLENVHSAVFAALQKSVDPEAWDVRLALQKTRQQVTNGPPSRSTCCNVHIRFSLCGEVGLQIRIKLAFVMYVFAFIHPA